MKIIDSHIHFGSALSFEMKKEHVLYAMERYGISKAVVSNVQATECDFSQNRLSPENQIPQIKAAEETVRFARENPGKIYAAIWMKPLCETCDDVIFDFVKSNLDVIKALKFHPYHSAVPFDDERIEKYMPLAEKFSLPVITHTGCGDCDNVERVFNMALRHPDVKFIMAHLGLGTDNRKAIELCKKLPNLYGDTAWVSVESAKKFISEAGDEKLLFGSDSPIDGPDTYLFNRSGERSLYQDYFHELPKRISEKSYEKLMHKNAERIFAL